MKSTQQMSCRMRQFFSPGCRSPLPLTEVTKSSQEVEALKAAIAFSMWTSSQSRGCSGGSVFLFTGLHSHAASWGVVALLLQAQPLAPAVSSTIEPTFVNFCSVNTSQTVSPGRSVRSYVCSARSCNFRSHARS